MIRRLHALYLRYVAVHADRLSSVPIGPRGRRIGQVERVERLGREIAITGWVDADVLRITWREGATEIVPDKPRADVAARRGGRLESGFQVTIPIEARDIVLWVERSGKASIPIAIAHPSHPASPAAHRRLRRAFLRDLARAGPDLIRHSISPTDRTKAAIKAALQLDLVRRGPVLDPGWFLPAEPPVLPPEPVTIILPVHNAFDLVQACLARVLAHSDAPWSLVIVDDASTDPAVRPWLMQWVASRPKSATLVSLDRNLGFVGAVNEGLEVAEGLGVEGPVILLNSDAMVPAGWISRLTAPLADRTVASVTPMSNAAELLSVPFIGPGIALKEGEGDHLDKVARRFGPMSPPQGPSGVGFCMAMSRDWLARVPRFDPAFGRGYGEEVDWCQKTAALGGRHLYQAGLFVEHVGGQSFGSEEKAQAMRRGNALISGRYPDHDASVQRFIAADPLATPRLALGIALAGQRADPLPVFMAHSLGGGAEVALAAEIATLPAALVLRVGGPLRWQVELHMGASTLAGRTNDLDCLRHMLAPISRIRLIYSCGVGDPDPVALPDFLLSLRRPGANDTVEMRIHDYFPLSPSYTLLEDDAFCGVPDVRSTAQSHISRRSDGSPVPLSEWREAWGRLVKAADAVIVFSQASLDLVKQAYPDAPLRLRPHRMPLTVRAVQPGRAGRFGILGNLNAHKGALVLCEIARLNPTEQFFIIGQCDSAISLPRNVTIHGDYHPEDIADLAERYGICGWLMPAIWPETFSFATREALETGLPVAGFALGAQAEALDAAPNGRTVPLQPRASMAARLIAALREALPMPGENLPASRSRR